jgi:hypothetical protein
MSTSAQVVLGFADNVDPGYTFKLDMKRIEELQSRLGGTGIGVIANRAFAGQFDIRDVYHTIRLGLIGGGMSPTDAQALVDQYVDGCALCPEGDDAAPLPTAQAILQALYFGMDEFKPEGKEPAGEPSAPASST